MDAPPGALCLSRLPVTLEDLDRCAFELHYLRNGYGLGMALAEFDELEWPEALRWYAMLDERLQADADALKPTR